MCAGEPIVLTPKNALRGFMGTERDALTIGNLYLDNGEQEPALKLDCKRAFERDECCGALCNTRPLQHEGHCSTRATAKCRRDLSPPWCRRDPLLSVWAICIRERRIGARSRDFTLA
jgi:hypothetical protein